MNLLPQREGLILSFESNESFPKCDKESETFVYNEILKASLEWIRSVYYLIGTQVVR